MHYGELSRTVRKPVFNGRADYNTNALSYYDFLADVSDEMKPLVNMLVNYLMSRDIEFYDTETIDFTRIGEWIKDPKDINVLEEMDNVLKVYAKVKRSEETELFSSKTLRDSMIVLKNSIVEKEDGIYSKDFEYVIKELDKKIDELTKRLDNIDPEGADIEVPISSAQISPFVPVPYKNLATVISNVDKEKFNVSFITDLHLQTVSESVPNYDNYRVLEQLRKLTDVCDVTVFCGDNVNSSSGSIGVDNDPIKPSDVKISTKYNMNRFSKSVNINSEKPVLIANGNHDRGGIPYATNMYHDFNMVLSISEIEEITGQKIYGGTLFPDKKIAIYKMYSDDFSEKQNGGFFVENDNQNGYQNGLISFAQFKDMANFFATIPDGYALLVFGHIIIDKDKMGNGQVLNQVFNAYKDKTDYTIPANSLQGIDNTTHTPINFINSQKQNRSFIGYIAGHYHSETNYNPNTDRKFNMACLLNGFPSVEQKGTDKEGTFYHIEIDTTAKTLKTYGIGNATNFLNWTY